MSVHLQRQIERLKKAILALGALVEESLQTGLKAVETRDPVLAQRVIDGDAQIDMMEIDVEEECLHTLALHQPVAFDLRFVIATLKINNDLERIADLSVNLAEQAKLLARTPPLQQPPINLAEMGRKVQLMLQQSLNSLVHVDTDMAHAVRSTDDEVDLMHRQTFMRVEQGLKANPENVTRLLNWLQVSRQLERVADHAVNIADDVLYMANGDIYRHNHPHPLELDRHDHTNHL